MSSVEKLKQKVFAAIDARQEEVIGLAKQVLDHPEPGFCEEKTSRLVQEQLSHLEVPYKANIALTGVKGFLRGVGDGPVVAILGELDSLRAPDHPKADPQTRAAHACGHHAQIGMLLGAALGLQVSGVMEELAGGVALMAVPAEELIDVEQRLQMREEGKLEFLSGKQEFIRLGAFDDVDMAMMVHTTSNGQDGKFALGGSSNSHLVKYVRFVGRAAHAGAAPHQGINALNAAMFALHAIHSQRETVKDHDIVRIHGIITKGGSAVSAVPDDVRLEARVRGRTEQVVEEANAKVDRALRAGALAVGGRAEITTVPGYLPLINNPTLLEVFRENAARLVGESQVVVRREFRTRGGSTDMGDLSHLMPVIHPYVGGATGIGHGDNYLISDYTLAVVQSAKAMALCVVDLLAEGAAKAKEVLASAAPRLTKEEYLAAQKARMHTETYEGV